MRRTVAAMAGNVGNVGNLSNLGDGKYNLLTTFKRDGTPVATTVWSVPLEGERFAFYTSSTSGKAKRLAHTSRVTVQPSNFRGKVEEGTRPIEATTQIVRGAELDSIRSNIKAKYGVMVTITRSLAKLGGFVKRKPQPYADMGVVVTPGASTSPTA